MENTEDIGDLMQYVLFYTFIVWKFLLGRTRAVRKLLNEILTTEQNFFRENHGVVSVQQLYFVFVSFFALAL